jgi:hypothetical protein
VKKSPEMDPNPFAKIIAQPKPWKEQPKNLGDFFDLK